MGVRPFGHLMYVSVLFLHCPEQDPDPGGRNLDRIAIVVPAFNEEASISSTISGIREMMEGSGIQGEIIVVDDGSTDGTSELCRDAGARVITHGSNLGYGAALKTGIRSTDCPLIAITDADGTYPVNRIPDLLAAMDGSDMAVGARTGDRVRIPLVRKPAKWVLRKLATRITGRKIPDLNSGLRVFRRELALEYMHLLPNGFSFTTTITIASMCDGRDVAYVPIDYYRREGRSKINPGHFPRFGMLILRLAVLFRPLRVFLPVAVFLFTVGLLKLVADVAIAVSAMGLGLDLFKHPIISTTAVIFLISSLQVLLVGMVAEALATRR